MATKTVFNGAIKIKALKGTGFTDGNMNYKWSSRTIPTDVKDDKGFISDDIRGVLNQNNTTNITIEKRIMEVTDNSASPPLIEHLQTYFLFGTEIDGTVLKSDDNYIAAPCPPYCSGGG